MLCQVTLTFTGKVSIRFEDLNVECDVLPIQDWLEVRDGNSSNSPMIGDKIYCYDFPDPMKSTGNSLTLVFKSNGYDHTPEFPATGFRIITDLGNFFAKDSRNDYPKKINHIHFTICL